MSAVHADVVIIGGGITGCAAAYYLAKRGAEVILLESQDLNTEASGRNAGSLHGQIQYPSFVEFGEEWAKGFLPALGLLNESLEMWDDLSDELGVDLEVSRKGGILVASSEAQMEKISRKVALEQSVGLPSRVLDQAGLRELAPWVSDRMVGGEYMAAEGKANPLLAGPAFARAAARLGAQIKTGQAVIGISRLDDGYQIVTDSLTMRAKKVLLVAGDGIPALAEPLGLRVPITSEPVQVSATEPVEPIVGHLVYYAGGKLTLKQSRSGSLLIGGGWPARQHADGSWVVNPASLRANLKVAMDVAPAIARALVVRTWAGIGNATPDLGPIIGEYPGYEGLIVGMYPHMGLTAGPLMGKILASMTVGESIDRDLSPFDPMRFAD